MSNYAQSLSYSSLISLLIKNPSWQEKKKKEEEKKTGYSVYKFELAWQCYARYDKTCLN